MARVGTHFCHANRWIEHQNAPSTHPTMMLVMTFLVRVAFVGLPIGPHIAHMHYIKLLAHAPG